MEPSASLTGTCPDEQDISEFAAGRLDGAGAQAMHEHLSGCTSCRKLVASLADGAVDAAAQSTPRSITSGASGRTARLDPRIGRKVGRYRIVERLGVGGMSKVYLATDESLDRKVALKFLTETLAADESARSRFLREGVTTNRLDHGNIADVYDCGEDDDAPYLVIRYYEGETLARRIERGPLPVEEAVGLLRQIAAGLHHAHKRNVVHRDVKPGNIFITGDGVVKLLDFGLAKLTSDDDEHPLTRSGDVLGTLEYMAPEQFSDGEVDARADLWSLGVVAYEMLSGERPFRGRTKAVLVGILKNDPPPLRERCQGLPPALDQLVARLLAKEPADRPADMAEVLDALSPSAAVPVRASRSRLWWLVGLAVVAVVVAGAFALRARRSAEADLVLAGVAREAEAAYRAAIDALNHGDQAGYVRAFDDPIDCFYDRPGLTRKALEERRAVIVTDKTARYVIDELRRVPTNDWTVAFREEGHIERPGRRYPHRKYVRLRNVDGEWKIIAEADDAHHGCWPDLD